MSLFKHYPAAKDKTSYYHRIICDSVVRFLLVKSFYRCHLRSVFDSCAPFEAWDKAELEPSEVAKLIFRLGQNPQFGELKTREWQNLCKNLPVLTIYKALTYLDGKAFSTPSAHSTLTEDIQKSFLTHIYPGSKMTIRHGLGDHTLCICKSFLRRLERLGEGTDPNHPYIGQKYAAPFYTIFKDLFKICSNLQKEARKWHLECVQSNPRYRSPRFKHNMLDYEKNMPVIEKALSKLDSLSMATKNELERLENLMADEYETYYYAHPSTAG